MINSAALTGGAILISDLNLKLTKLCKDVSRLCIQEYEEYDYSKDEERSGRARWCSAIRDFFSRIIDRVGSFDMNSGYCVATGGA